MLKVPINNKDYSLPEKWSEININTYQKSYALRAKYCPDGKFADEAEKHFFKKELVSNLINCPEEILNEHLYVHELEQVFNKLEFVIGETDQTPIKESFEIIISGVQYYFDFKLFSKQKGAQFIDALSLQKDEQTIPNLHELMACMVRPVIGKTYRYNVTQRLLNKNKRKIYSEYKIEPYDAKTRSARAEIFKQNLGMDKTLPLLFFCFNTKIEYFKILAGYSDKKLMKLKMKRV